MINANNHQEIIEAAYKELQDITGTPEEIAVTPDGVSDYDLHDANDFASYEITEAHFPEIALLEAYARQGYLDNDRIWEEIGDAVARALLAYAEERHEDALLEEDPEE